jgi:hypothetical protein
VEPFPKLISSILESSFRRKMNILPLCTLPIDNCLHFLQGEIQEFPEIQKAYKDSLSLAYTCHKDNTAQQGR